jgi:hypothetical protein
LLIGEKELFSLFLNCNKKSSSSAQIQWSKETCRWRWPGTPARYLQRLLSLGRRGRNFWPVPKHYDLQVLIDGWVQAPCSPPSSCSANYGRPAFLSPSPHLISLPPAVLPSPLPTSHGRPRTRTSRSAARARVSPALVLASLVGASHAAPPQAIHPRRRLPRVFGPPRWPLALSLQAAPSCTTVLAVSLGRRHSPSVLSQVDLRQGLNWK